MFLQCSNLENVTINKNFTNLENSINNKNYIKNNYYLINSIKYKYKSFQKRIGINKKDYNNYSNSKIIIELIPIENINTHFINIDKDFECFIIYILMIAKKK